MRKKANKLDSFDYRVECDDFVLYELGRLIDEDHASLADEEFSRLIDEGIREHIETNLEIRAELAGRLRTQSASPRVLQAVEDIESSLRDVGLVLQTYTAYLFQRLEECAGGNADQEEEARTWIERWQNGEVLREEMAKRLKAIGPPAVAPLADLLFDSPDNRMAAETALDLLGSIPSSVSARVLAHVVSEPMLEEDLEIKTYGLVRAMWPLPRRYIVYSLRPHTHEDIPFRWFQLLNDGNEPDAVDCILEEVLVHAEDPNYREDILALVELLRESRDPGMDDKVMQALNNPDTPQPAIEILEAFLKTPSQLARKRDVDPGPWARLDRLRAANKRYLAAARLFDAGRKADSSRKLDELLKEESRYPFALMLKRLI